MHFRVIGEISILESISFEADQFFYLWFEIPIDIFTIGCIHFMLAWLKKELELQKRKIVTLNLLNSSTAADDVAKRQAVASLLIIFQS